MVKFDSKLEYPAQASSEWIGYCRLLANFQVGRLFLPGFTVHRVSGYSFLFHINYYWNDFLKRHTCENLDQFIEEWNLGINHFFLVCAEENLAYGRRTDTTFLICCVISANRKSAQKVLLGLL
jgi:hypothetical protein